MTLITQIKTTLNKNEMPVGFTATVKKDVIIGLVLDVYHTDIIKSMLYQGISVGELLTVLITAFEKVWGEVKHNDAVYEITVGLDKDPIIIELGPYYFIEKEYVYSTFDINGEKLTEEDVEDITDAISYTFSVNSLFAKGVFFEKITRNYEETDDAIFFLDIEGLIINIKYPVLS